MRQVDKDFELRSEEVQEILGTPPNWILRSATSVILIVLIILLSGSFIYKYPDIINARVTILSENPPISIVARKGGKLKNLFVSDRQFVKEGHVIGIIDNSANFQDVLRMELFLNSVLDIYYTPENLVNLNIPEGLSLGQIQSYYLAFITQWSEYVNFIELDFFGQQIRSLSNQASDYENYLVSLKDQVDILRKDLQLSAKKFGRDSTLFFQKVLSESQYEQSQGEFFNKKYAYKSAFSNLYNTQIRINQLKQQVLEFEIQKAEKGKRLSASLKEKFGNLNAQIKEWKQNFMLIAPIDGLIAFTDLWSVNQFVNEGSVVFTVVPEIEQQIIGKLVLPIKGSGKVEKGQHVYMKLDNFPFLEFGLIEGKIINMSMIPVKSRDESYYTAVVSLSNGLVTNHNKQLTFNQEMQGNAEIITKDRRLIERLVEPIVVVFSKNVE